jgi:hypothetical protein
LAKAHCNPARPLYQDPTHCLGRGGEKMPPTFPLISFTIAN